MNSLVSQNMDAEIKIGESPIEKIEHFYAVSNRPEALFEFFSEVLGLPEIWPFTDYGGFSSGGLSVGNSVLEVVGDDTQSEDQSGVAYFNGIAFEPIDTAESTIGWLDKQGIDHSPAYPFKEVIDDKERTHWVTCDIDIPPKESRIFVCDYKNREAVEKGRNVARLKLLDSDKCPLGIQSLKEIVLTFRNLDQGIALWSNLLGSERRASRDKFSFTEGPDINLVSSESDGILEIVLEVRSLTEAKTVLQSKSILGTSTTDRLTISKAAIQGLNITLVEAL